MPEISIADLTGEARQARLVKAFTAGEVGGVPAPVEHIQTHLNHVFLSGDRAFKMKRAVRLPFVDFTTNDQRRAACDKELSVNTALGSPFYLNVAPIARNAAGAFRVGANGEAEDWAVVMRRFDASQQLDVMARNGLLTVPHAEQAAVRIASMHAAALPRSQAGHAADYRHTIHNLRRTEQEAAARLGLTIGEPAPYDRLDAELARVDPLIEKRQAAGKVRRVHGDLHLRNLCMFNGVPTPFDALEFDERMASTDVLYDLAFLLMDLRHCDLPRHANAAMNVYWDAAGEDEEALQLMPFFMALRATVRMAVAVAEECLDEAEAYRALAFRLLDRSPGRLVAIGGLSGSGKSAVAQEVAYRLAGPAGARVLRSDVLRKRALGIALDQRAGGDVYAPEKRAGVYRDLAARAAAGLAAGASVVVDATFQVASARAAIEAAGNGRFHAFWLDAPLDVRLERIARRQGDASDADAAVAMSQTDPEQLGDAWRRVDARASVREIAASILKELP